MRCKKCIDFCKRFYDHIHKLEYYQICYLNVILIYLQILSVNTIKSWISVLEQSYIIFLIYPYCNNFSKRIVKMPKLYFFDTALASSLLEIENEVQLKNHYLKGNLFETLIISDLIKQRYNKGLYPNLSFYRDRSGHEVDCILKHENELIPVEIKISQTFNLEYLDEIKYWLKITNSSQKGLIIYGGDSDQMRNDAKILSWKKINLINEIIQNN